MLNNQGYGFTLIGGVDLSFLKTDSFLGNYVMCIWAYFNCWCGLEFPVDVSKETSQDNRYFDMQIHSYGKMQMEVYCCKVWLGKRQNGTFQSGRINGRCLSLRAFP